MPSPIRAKLAAALPTAGLAMVVLADVGELLAKALPHVRAENADDPSQDVAAELALRLATTLGFALVACALAPRVLRKEAEPLDRALALLGALAFGATALLRFRHYDGPYLALEAIGGALGAAAFARGKVPTLLIVVLALATGVRMDFSFAHLSPFIGAGAQVLPLFAHLVLLFAVRPAPADSDPQVERVTAKDGLARVAAGFALFTATQIFGGIMLLVAALAAKGQALRIILVAWGTARALTLAMMVLGLHRYAKVPASSGARQPATLALCIAGAGLLLSLLAMKAAMDVAGGNLLIAGQSLHDLSELELGGLAVLGLELGCLFASLLGLARVEKVTPLTGAALLGLGLVIVGGAAEVLVRLLFAGQDSDVARLTPTLVLWAALLSTAYALVRAGGRARSHLSQVIA